MGIQQGAKTDRKPEVIADRYQVEERLGKGGMGTVYRVLDRAAQRQVALKLLDQKAAQSRTISALFEREYHTLAQLAHPRIIEVYDYGVDEHGPGAYYTMELLDGADLRKLAPRSWKQACALLHDVASSLALLHSRRLLHRDISARNVRCTADGRAKLIDFGAMVPFGSPPKLIGTPPYVAPEAYHLQPLDQRADLYSLGALAYWLIGGRYAYQARELALLPDAWRSQPKALSALVPDLPPALNDLVMSLLNLDRMARPFCAAEVMERLAAIAGLDTDEQLAVSQAYLNTPSLVGRGDLLVQVRRHMMRALAGIGGAVMIRGHAGTGRSRFLDACVLEGKLAGAVVLRADATDANAGNWGAVRAVARQLLDAVPQPALQAAREHAPVLGHIIPELLGRLEADSREAPALKTFETPQELRPQAQTAFLDWLVGLSRHRCLVLAVDDVHRIDEPSAAFVALMSNRALEERVVVVVTAETDAPGSSEQALSLLAEAAIGIELEDLDIEDTERLLCSIFGEVPNVRLVSDRLHAISNGNPRAVMQLAQHLLDRGVVRYEAGAWTLPTSIDAADLPHTLSEALKARTQQLSPTALGLAQAMALGQNQRFSFDECVVLSGRRGRAGLLQDLNELVTSGMVSTDGQYYALGHHGWGSALLDGVHKKGERALHRRVAEVFSLRGSNGFRAAMHLFAAGEDERGLDVLVHDAEHSQRHLVQNTEAFYEYIQSLPPNWLDIYRQALRLCQKHHRPRKQGFLLRMSLLRFSILAGLEDIEILHDVVNQLVQDSGLGFYRDLDETEDREARLWRALEMAQQHYDATAESERVLPPAEAIPELANAVHYVMGTASNAHDYSILEAMPSLEPLEPLSPSLGVVNRVVNAGKYILSGRHEQAMEEIQGILDRIAQPDRAGLDEMIHRITHFSWALGLGVLEASLGLESSLKWADEIEQDLLHQVNAWRIRMVHHLRQGNAEKAEQCKKRVEMLRIQNSPAQHFEDPIVSAELLTHGLADDLVQVKADIEDIEKVARRFRTWMPSLHFARGEYQRIRGDCRSALKEFERALELIAPGRHVIWPSVVASQLNALFELERFSEGREIGEQSLLAAEREDIGFGSALIQMPLAVIQAKADEYECAVRNSEAVIDRFRALGVTGLNLGLAYETRARVAISMNDQENFGVYARLCAGQYRAGHNAALTAKYERLMQAAREANLGMPEELRRAAELSVSLSRGGDVASNVRQRLAGCDGRSELIDRALALVVERTGSQWGYLYLLADGELTLAAQSTGLAPPENLQSELRAFIGRFMGDETDTEQSDIPTRSCFLQSCVSHVRALEPMLLAIDRDGQSTVVGVAVVCQRERNAERPGYAFFEAVARCLHEADHQPVSHDSNISALGQNTAPTDSMVEGRYWVEAVLGKGGMGAVYRARDTSTGKSVAVKRALDRSDQGKPSAASEDRRESDRLETLLRREYQTLQSLAHPRIVEVYDFGVDEQGPYYTMELLDGDDLRQLAPLPWQKSCELLRDVASSLSLLHSRRLLHRDVTARNVRCTAEGHAKLMDFGAMTPMGLPKDTVGTPPHMPPESVYSQPLDQRSDLYSLGALAYWLLTGRHAYPALRMEELVDLWRSRPSAPSSMVTDIPEALDTLVMSLLSLDPVARPTCAAEVMERLSAIASLRMEEQLLVPQAYLTTPTLVGRDDSLLQVRKQVIRALRGRGGAVMVQGPPGVGRSRFLDACVLEGKLAGMAVLRADASDAHGGDYAVTRALVHQLMREIPALALRAVQPHLSVLCHVLPDLSGAEAARSESSCAAASAQNKEPSQHRPSAPPALDREGAPQPRPRIQAALREWLIDIAQYRALMIAVDDTHRIDEPSAALLALLGNEANNNRLVIAVSAESDARATAPGAVNLLSQTAVAVRLKNLARKESEQLLSSVFGGVPNVRLLADRLHKSSQGNPRAIMRLAQHLVDKDVVRYQAGEWTLPNSIDAADLPRTLSEALKAQLQKLSPDALQLARAMAIGQDQSFSFEEFLLLSDRTDREGLLQALNELVTSGIVSTDGQYYCLDHQGWVSPLTDDLGEAVECALHLSVAKVFSLRGSNKCRVAMHLFAAGDEERGLDALVHDAEHSQKHLVQNSDAFYEHIQSLPSNWPDIYKLALRLCQKLKRPRRQVFLLRMNLVRFSVIAGLEDIGILHDVVDQLVQDSGLGFYERLGDSVDADKRVWRALELAQRHYDATAESDRVLSPAEAIPELANAVSYVMSTASNAQDYTLMEALPSLAPLEPLSPALGVVNRVVNAGLYMFSARHEQAVQEMRAILDRIAQPDRAGLEDAVHRLTRFGWSYGLGLIEASFGLKSSLKWADEIEQDLLHQSNAWQIRMVYYLRQGDLEQTEQCKKRVEMLRIQNSPAQQYERGNRFTELVAYGLADDLLRVKGATEAIEKEARRFRTWMPTLHFANGEYQRIRGDSESALSEYEAALQLVAPGRHVVWPYVAGARLRALLDLERFSEGKEVGKQDLVAAQRVEIGHHSSFIQMPLALIQASLGDYETAVRNAEAVLARFHALGTTGLNLGLAYETRAHVAILMGDHNGFGNYARLCAEQYRAGRNPGLTAKYERLLQTARKAGLQVADGETDVRRDGAGSDLSDSKAGIRRAIAGCRDRRERTQKALALLLEHCDAKSGHLFGTQEEGLTWLSSVNEGASREAPPEELRELAERYMSAEVEESTVVTMTAADQDAVRGAASSATLTLSDGRGFEPVLLFSRSEGRPVLVGLAAMVPAGDRLRTPQPQLVSTISDALLDTGDVVSMYAAA